MNDITSHLFDVPRKTNKAVKGVEPGKAMPIPYTNACGACHEADKGCSGRPIVRLYREGPPEAGVPRWASVRP